MALFHLHVTQVKRSAGQSVVTSAAYRAGEKLYSEYYGEVSDYTHKGGVVCTDILLPPQAPAEYQDRATLWNAVEKAERGKKAQLAYSFDIALQNEFSLEETAELSNCLKSSSSSSLHKYSCHSFRGQNLEIEMRAFFPVDNSQAGKGVVPILRQREHLGQQALCFQAQALVPQMIVAHNGVSLCAFYAKNGHPCIAAESFPGS